MATRGTKKTIAVDTKFFNTIFEKERKKLQQKLGVMNLSQPDFTKMIKGLKIIEPKNEISKINIRRKRNDFFKI